MSSCVLFNPISFILEYSVGSRGFCMDQPSSLALQCGGTPIISHLFIFHSPAIPRSILNHSLSSLSANTFQEDISTSFSKSIQAWLDAIQFGCITITQITYTIRNEI
ncbi:hypothetical protein ACMYSQ_009867 [Aspergillus niger]